MTCILEFAWIFILDDVFCIVGFFYFNKELEFLSGATRQGLINISNLERKKYTMKIKWSFWNLELKFNIFIINISWSFLIELRYSLCCSDTWVRKKLCDQFIAKYIYFFHAFFYQLFLFHAQVKAICLWCAEFFTCVGISLNISSWIQMRTVSMCFSILQVPRFRIPTLGNFCRESFHSLSRSDGNSSSFKLLGSKIYGLDRGHNKKWTRRHVTTNAEGRNKTTQHSKPSNIRQEILDGVVSKSATINVNKKEISQFQKIQYCDIQQKISENKDLASLVTVIVFDLETTGFLRESERIIEFALQDLLGGKNSTFQTLVNPQRYVPNPHIHGITSSMVNKPDVPRYCFLCSWVLVLQLKSQLMKWRIPFCLICSLIEIYMFVWCQSFYKDYGQK